ncbi:MAG: hypothetical protein ACRD5G_17265 [Candidatus Acidiferrales bacterium]
MAKSSVSSHRYEITSVAALCLPQAVGVDEHGRINRTTLDGARCNMSATFFVLCLLIGWFLSQSWTAAVNPTMLTEEFGRASHAMRYSNESVLPA